MSDATDADLADFDMNTELPWLPTLMSDVFVLYAPGPGVIKSGGGRVWRGLNWRFGPRGFAGATSVPGIVYDPGPTAGGVHASERTKLRPDCCFHVMR